MFQLIRDKGRIWAANCRMDLTAVCNFGKISRNSGILPKKMSRFPYLQSASGNVGVSGYINSIQNAGGGYILTAEKRVVLRQKSYPLILVVTKKLYEMLIAAQTPFHRRILKYSTLNALKH